jgi:hypothetical protein
MSKVDELIEKAREQWAGYKNGFTHPQQVSKIQLYYERALATQREELKKKVVEVIRKIICKSCLVKLRVKNKDICKTDCLTYKILTSITTIFSEVEK